MTATTSAPTASPAKTTQRRSLRWLRLVLPFAVVLTLTAVTGTAHIIQQADHGDAAFLSPTSTDAIGAATLAGRLSQRGVTVERVSNTSDALSAAATGDATLFVPAPALVFSGYLDLLAALPRTARVVLVAPGPATVREAGLAVALGRPRWTAAAPSPGCAETWADGPAAVLRQRYAAFDGGRFACYAGGVVELGADGAPVTLVGASDVFRNDRLDEHANAAVAVGLLSRTRRVVWLDLHRHELPPPGPPRTDPQGAPAVSTPAPPVGTGDPGGQADSPPPPENSITDAFPPAFWAVLVLLALAAIAVAAAVARRLGAPVAEPLPVRVRAAETVRGLGGLYRRARADDTSLARIQAAARRRLADHLGLPPDGDLEDLANRVPGVAPHEVMRLLGDPGQDLATTAEAVQNLVRYVKGNST